MESILKGYGTTSSAKDELGEIFGSRYLFQTPKPRKLIKELVRAAAGKNAFILDFFAGSGTTGHAVMDLNKEDNGKRRFILVTNNENGICRTITYERLKRALEKEKYEESLKYYKINYVPR
jgi:adenine-specific DNA-methyltransferase